jgi:hypothetical protein
LMNLWLASTSTLSWRKNANGREHDEGNQHATLAPRHEDEREGHQQELRPNVNAR